MKLNLLAGFVFVFFLLSCGSSGGGPSTSGTVTFTVSPMQSTDYSGIGPMGSLNPRMGHAFPTDHGYFLFKENVYPPSYQVFAPAAGTIIAIQYSEGTWPDNSGQTGTYRDWTVTLEHTQDIKSKFGHMSSVEAGILAQAGTLQPDTEKTVSIAVSAGDQIGLCGGRPGVVYNLDWYVIDQNVSQSFIDTTRYGRIKNSAHFFGYCSTSLQSQYTPRFYNPEESPLATREATPLGGEICYDQSGKLAGNWFHNSTTASEAAITAYNNQLAFVYDQFDPDLLRVTFGGPEGEIGGSTISTPLGLYVTTYQVVGNIPDPVTVNVASGEVIYHLQGLELNSETTFEATLLVQMMGAETVSVEGFTGYVTSPVFSSNVETYIR